MKTIIMSDQHLGKFWKSNNSASNRARKLIDYFIYNIKECCKQKKDYNLIFAGDLYESIHTTAEMLVYIKKRLSPELLKFNHIYVIAGNHETFIDKNGDQQTLLSVALDSVNTDLYYTGIGSCVLEDGINYIFIPFQNEIENIFENEVPKYLRADCNNVIVSHITPKEIFSFEHMSIEKYIDQYNSLIGEGRIPYIILGHYHEPCSLTYKGTKVISIGNSYYLTIGDLRQSNAKKYKKRYLILEDNKLKSKEYALPPVYTFEIDSQEVFDQQVVPFIKDPSNNISINDIVYLRSKSVIDYSVLMFEGYDIYFDMLENTDDGLITLKESLSETINDNSSGKTLNERWNRYIDLIPEASLSASEKAVATWLFGKRNDNDITLNNIRGLLSAGK